MITHAAKRRRIQPDASSRSKFLVRRVYDSYNCSILCVYADIRVIPEYTHDDDNYFFMK